MSHADHTRDPCPWVILNDFGGAFAMGAVGGGIWHGIKGARNSPRGERLVGAISTIKARAPVTGGNFGVWGGMFSTFDCAVKGWRQKEDAWNAIISGFMTGGCLAARSGPKSALGSAIACGILLGVFEGVGVLLSRVFSEGTRPQLPQPVAWTITPTKSTNSEPMRRSFGTTVAGPRRMDAGSQPMNLNHGRSYHTDAELHGFSHDHPTVQRRQSARQLIDRYESILREEPSTARRPPSAARFLGVSSSRSVGKGKRRSLSASLRNFLSVFQKGRKGKDGDDQEDVPTVVVDAPSMAQIPSMYTESAPLSHDTGSVALSAGKVSALHSGALLYLSMPPSSTTSPILPSWTSCNVTLHTLDIIITWYTTHGNPSTHVLPLDGCTDVRSLSLNRLDLDEKALLLTSTDQSEPKVFELLFEGRRREKFAASSSQERARWVSAIWDTLLQRQSQGTTRVQALTIRTNFQRKGQEYLQPPSASEYPSSEYTSSSGVESETSLTTEQSLPPTPSSKYSLSTQSPARFSLHDSPQNHSPMSLLPPRPPSPWSPSPKSPSIAKLGNLSVVTQRLAQIDNTSSPGSASSDSIMPHLRGAQTIRPIRPRRAFAEIHKIKDESFSSDSPLSSGGPSPQPRSPASIETYSSRSRSAFARSGTSLTSPPTLPETQRIIREGLPIQFSSSSTADKGLQVPITDPIKEGATITVDQTIGISEQIAALQRDIQHLPSELTPLLADTARQSSAEAKEAITSTIQALVVRVEDIQQQSSSSTVQLQGNSIMKILDVMQTQLKSTLPRVLEKLDVIHDNQEREMSMSHANITMNNLGPSFSTPTSPADRSKHCLDVDFSDIYAKLNELASLYKTGNASLSPTVGNPQENAETPEKLAHELLDDKLKVVLDYLNADEEQKKVQLEQQADSVRYLNELNSWLDAFVSKGTIQIQAVATGVEQICKQLGISTSEELSSTNLRGQVQQLLEAARSQVHNEDDLRSTVHELIQVVQEHLTHGDEQRRVLVTDSVMEIINRQRADQEQMLRVLSSELTEEIRGERLRFVEAMKEATAINVQGAFALCPYRRSLTAELGREVAVMTQDVGRLHKEKQAIEQQIADLFAFYSKQKQESEVCPIDLLLA
ncbi:Tim17/Tim22/Tim23/Pmp24 family-domain-containing protein [Suillus bovinus]|nr:Tim17/Tim22/Tim23/Pmp24 family-domain-containing protein [Suillus bovinus]KAG2145990.1 Tim17/Tim22/Tim23/Pmp24 family-domain-containing protein [Suillus bovinus]